jgi:hypothetical protein
MDAETVARELYALRPAEFVAGRDARVAEARQAGDRSLAAEIKAMRRPTVSAWVMNLFALERGDRLEQLFSLGAALRDAQSSLSADKLRELGEQRRRVIGALGQEAATLAAEHGQPVGSPVVGDVEQTLQAALADPDAAAQVKAGRLTTSLRYTGFGDVAVSSTTAGARGSRRRQAPADGGRADADAKAEAEAERRRRERVRAALRDAERTLATATKAAERAQRQLDDARERLDAAQTDAEAAQRAHAEAAAALDEARSAEQEARAAVDDEA